MLNIISAAAQGYMGISPGKIINDLENINSKSSFNSGHTDQIVFLLEGTHTQSPQNNTHGKRNEEIGPRRLYDFRPHLCLLISSHLKAISL